MYRKPIITANRDVNAPYQPVRPQKLNSALHANGASLGSISSPQFTEGRKAPAYIPDRSNRNRLSFELQPTSGPKAPSYTPHRTHTLKRALSSISNSDPSDEITIQSISKTNKVIHNEDDSNDDIKILSTTEASKQTLANGIASKQDSFVELHSSSSAPTISPNNKYIIPTIKRHRISTDIPINRNVTSSTTKPLSKLPINPSEPILGRPSVNQQPLPVSQSTSIPITRPTSADSTRFSGNILRCYEVMYRKPSTKKHKTWDYDGQVKQFSNGTLILENTKGKQVGQSASTSNPLILESIIKIGSYEVEISLEISAQSLSKETAPSKPIKTQTPVSTFRPPAFVNKPTNSSHVSGISSNFEESLSKPVSSSFDNKRSGFISRSNLITMPVHDPLNPNSITLPRYPTKLLKIDQTPLDVVIDPYIGKHLRPHQIEGVKFMYECVMGYRDYEGNGALLADEMGLGKTLMTITLIWTLLKQTPIYNTEPLIKRALIICPVSLISNWRKEFRKWLGHRIDVFVADGKTDIRQFSYSRIFKVIICGYERFRNISKEMNSAAIDLIVMDEGHRLKSSNNKSSQAILNFDTKRRIILTGTPIQNDLGEFFSMVDIINPGILGTYQQFKKDFENPIVKSRQPEASSKDVEKGTAMSEELSRITRMFTLRRTADTLDKYLPPKTNSVIFCKPTSEQARLYKEILQSSAIKKCVGSDSPMEHLRAITLLKKLCNSPALLRDQDFDVFKLNFPSSLPFASGKLRFLMLFLSMLRKYTKEKVVVVSGFTKTLDIIQNALGDVSMSCLRLDGETPTNQRQGLVDKFNKSSQSDSFVFLLSAKSGGTGLNLIGASRLFLYDTDWNPSVDLQAMARVHRDGQKYPVFIYRLLLTGAMDEKIYQRQITKQGLADSFMDGSNDEDKKGKGKGKFTGTLKSKSSGRGTNCFSLSELQDLFKFRESTKCHTHDLLGCTCCKTSTDDTDSATLVGPKEPSGLTYDQIIKNKSQTQRPNQDDSKPLLVVDDEDEDEDEDDEDIFVKKTRKSNASMVEISDDEMEPENEVEVTEKSRFGGFTTAKDVAEGTAPIPKYLREKANDEMKGLYQYKHLDPAQLVLDHKLLSPPTLSRSGTPGDDGDNPVLIDIEEDEETIEKQVLLDDDILLRTIQHKKSPVTFIFTKNTLDKKK